MCSVITIYLFSVETRSRVGSPVKEEFQSHGFDRTKSAAIRMEINTDDDDFESKEKEISGGSVAGDLRGLDYTEEEISEYAESEIPVPKKQHSPRKRKHSEVESVNHGSRTQKKRPRSNHITDYRSLLNEVIEEAATSTISDYTDLMYSSQLGLTLWSTEEKNAIFNALDRKGKDDLQALANAVGTKSVPEVSAYLRLLQQSLSERYMTDRNHGLVRLTDIPAAAEIGPECESALEKAANLVLKRQHGVDVSFEKKKHGEAWLLDQETLNRLSQSDPKSESSTAEPSKLSLALDLIDLEGLLVMSERLFMNSQSPQENWRDFAIDKEKPSIFHTAFLDFYNLIVILTRRLVQSTIFCAMSRLRALKAIKKDRAPRVRVQDVFSAIQALGMKKDRGDFIIGLARRCKLHVKQDGSHGASAKVVLSYNEVERQLRKRRKTGGGTTLPSSDEMGESLSDESEADLPPAPEIIAAEASQTSDPDISDTSMSDSETDFLPMQYPPHESQHQKARRREKAEDKYAEAFDKQNNQKEEIQLWATLGIEQKIKPEEQELPPRPPVVRKTMEDIVDWRDLIDYQSPWERFEIPVREDEFRKLRRTKRGRQQSEVDKDSAVGVTLDSEEAETNGDSLDEVQRRRMDGGSLSSLGPRDVDEAADGSSSESGSESIEDEDKDENGEEDKIGEEEDGEGLD